MFHGCLRPMEIGVEVSSEVLDWAGEVRALGTEAATEAGRYWIHLGLVLRLRGGEWLWWAERGTEGTKEQQLPFHPLLPPTAPPTALSCPGDSLTVPWAVRPPPGSVCQDVQGTAARRADLGEDRHPGSEDLDQ